jgi:hypothetical protein
MANKEWLEELVTQDLQRKASEVQPSDEMLSRMMGRIKADGGGNSSRIKYRIPSFHIRRWIVVTVCSAFILMGIMFTLSEDVRAATLEAIDTLKSIFVIDRSENGEYAIVEKAADDFLTSFSVCNTTYLSDEELTRKMGFHVYFPEKLNDEFKLMERVEGVGIREQVSLEVIEQMETTQLKAINDAAVFDSLAEYNPFRDVFAIYEGEKGTMLFIGMEKEVFPPIFDKNSISFETTIGGKSALWIETVRPDYKSISSNGIGKADLYTKPDKMLKDYYLVWNSDGIKYELSTSDDLVLTMEEAVELAETFMVAQ